MSSPKCVQGTAAARSQGSQWLQSSQSCPFTDVEGSDQLPAGKQDELRPYCDLPGRVSRAQYVADVRQAKRARLSTEVESAPVVEDLVDDADDPLPEDDVDGNGVPSEPTLKNMSWWDGVSYNSLERWVPTVGKVPAT